MVSSEDTTTCSWVEDSLDDYLGGDLGPEEVTRFEDHVLACSSCEEELSLARRVVQNLGELPRFRCPEGVVERAFKQVRRDRPEDVRDRFAPLRAPRFASRWRLAAALGLAALVAVVVSLRESPEPQPPRQLPSEEEVALAVHQVEYAMLVLGETGYRSAKVAGQEAIESGLIRPIEGVVRTLLKSEALRFKKQGKNQHAKENPKCG